MNMGGTRLGLALAAIVWALPAFAEHKVAIQVDEADPKVMNIALNNAQNIIKYYEEIGEEVSVEIVTYGPGLNMLRSDTSPVRLRIEEMSMMEQPIHFRACANTIAGMTRKQGKAPPLMEAAEVIPSGAVYLMELQGQGYAYLRP
jgi:intracellular sulfur oxidation DsrE/DsrF family protein